LSHERRQVFRHRGAGGVGEFGPQSGRKRLQELHRVEGDGGQMTHLHAPTDLPWPQPFGRAPYVVNTTEVLLFHAVARFLRAMELRAQISCAPFPSRGPPHQRARVTTCPMRSFTARFTKETPSSRAPDATRLFLGGFCRTPRAPPGPRRGPRRSARAGGPPAPAAWRCAAAGWAAPRPATPPRAGSTRAPICRKRSGCRPPRRIARSAPTPRC